MRLPLLALAGLVIAAAPQPTDEERLQKALNGLVAGKPVHCIHQGPTTASDTYGSAIVYRDSGTRYLNRFGGDCRIRPNFEALIIRINGGLLCSGDLARIVDTSAGFERGSCVFGDFIPYKKPR